jgi:hypothetical protein
VLRLAALDFVDTGLFRLALRCGEEVDGLRSQPIAQSMPNRSTSGPNNETLCLA